jgi:hypothetical protein
MAQLFNQGMVREYELKAYRGNKDNFVSPSSRSVQSKIDEFRIPDPGFRHLLNLPDGDRFF